MDGVTESRSDWERVGWSGREKDILREIEREGCSGKEKNILGETMIKWERKGFIQTE